MNSIFDNLPDVLTVREVAQIFRVSPLTIKRRVMKDQLKTIRINERGDMRFLKSYIMEYLGYE